MDNWDNINAVQRVQDYIAEHITEPITLHMLSKCSRLIAVVHIPHVKEYTGKTPLDRFILCKHPSALGE